MADLATFEAEVRNKIKELSSKNATTRLKAAQWLGEAGDPVAITGLVQAYKNDSESRVRDAAKYSLGMFRALEDALDSDKEEQALALLQRVALEGKRGRRVPIPTRTLVKFEIVLLLILVILLAVNFVVLPLIKNIGTTTEPVPTAVAVNDKDRTTLLAELRSQYTKIRDDANTLLAQYQNVLGGNEASCQVFFNILSPMALSARNSAEFPEINGLVQQLNTTLDDFSAAKQTYDTYCNTRSNPLTVNDVTGPLATLTEIVTRLPEFDTALTALETEPTATIPPTAAPTVEAAETPTPEFTALPTLNARPHLQALQRIIDDVTAPTGANGLLETYWNDVRNTGQTAGCSAIQPTIPSDYPPLGPTDAEQNPALSQAISAVNLGLADVRTGWTHFTQACNSGSPQFSVNAGLQTTQSAQDNFNAALALFEAAMQEG